MSNPTSAQAGSQHKPVQQPAGVVEIGPNVKQNEIFNKEGHILDSDPDKKLKPRNHEQEFNDLIREQIKIRRLKIDLRTYSLPKNPKTGESYTMNDIKFTQFKQINAASYVVEVEMNDNSKFQVQL